MAIFGKLCRKKILDNDEEVKRVAFLHEKWERYYESGIAEARENYLFYFNIVVLDLREEVLKNKMLSPGLETTLMAEKLLAFPRDFLLAPKAVSGGVNIAIFLILPLAWHYIIHKMKGNYKLLYVHLTKRTVKVYT